MKSFNITDFSCRIVDKSPGDIAPFARRHYLIQVEVEDDDMAITLCVGLDRGPDDRQHYVSFENPKEWLVPDLITITELHRHAQKMGNSSPTATVMKFLSLTQALANRIFHQGKHHPIMVQYDSEPPADGPLAGVWFSRVGVVLSDGYLTLEFSPKEPSR